MFAMIAAVLFGLALLLQLLRTDLGEVINAATLTTAGLLFFALHFASGWRGGGRGYRGRRPGPG